MKAIYINAKDKTVTEIQISSEESILQQLYRLIDCEYIDLIRLENGDVMYVDDIGLMVKADFFSHRALYRNPIAGSAVIMGPDRYDDEVGAPLCEDCGTRAEDLLELQWVYPVKVERDGQEHLLWI